MDIGQIIEGNRNRIITFVFILISLGLVGAHYGHITSFSELEMWGFVTGLWSIWWAVLNLPRNWAIGLLNEAIFFVMFLQGKLYANAFLQVIFAVVSIWGWYEWLRGGGKKTELPVTYLDKFQWLESVLIVVLITMALMIGIQLSTGTYIFTDVLSTSLSLFATYLLGWRKVENWLIWFVVDLLSIYLFFTQGFILTAALYAIFAALCIKGLYDWRVIFKSPKNQIGIQYLKVEEEANEKISTWPRHR